MSKRLTTIIVMAVMVLASVCATQGVTINTVPVGNPGNDADDTGYGAVAYNYNIGKYEVTASQYKDFLNEVGVTTSNDPYGLYNSEMNSSTYGCKIYWDSSTSRYDVQSGYENRPVNYVSWGDAARFSNWLTNGQGSGDTETGTYALNGAMSDVDLLAVTVPDASQRASWSNGSKPYFLLPSENEWYKAAYHKNDGLTGNYFDYPTSSDSVPSNNLDGGGNNATFLVSGDDWTIGSPYYRTEVGAHVNSKSPYDTFDQGGNVWEWNEAVIGSSRGVRGASFICLDYGLHAAYRDPSGGPSFEAYSFGFRVALVPEPATVLLLALGGLAVLKRKRKP